MVKKKGGNLKLPSGGGSSFLDNNPNYCGTIFFAHRIITTAMQRPYSDNDNDDASTLGSKCMSGDEGQSVTSNSSRSRPFPRIFNAGIELESLCRAEISGGNTDTLGFPPLCLPIARLLAGNQCCVDCGEERSDLLKYASIGYGTILCQDCAHRVRRRDGLGRGGGGMPPVSFSFLAASSSVVLISLGFFISLLFVRRNDASTRGNKTTARHRVGGGIQRQAPQGRALEPPLNPRHPRGGEHADVGLRQTQTTVAPP